MRLHFWIFLLSSVLLSSLCEGQAKSRFRSSKKVKVVRPTKAKSKPRPKPSFEPRDIGFDPALKGGRKNAAGIEVRMLKNGLDYIQKVATKVLSNAVPNMRIETIRQPIQGGTVVITESRFLGFKPPSRSDYYLKRPNKFRFDLRGIGAVIAGKFDADVKIAIPIKAKGNYRLTIESLDVQADMAIWKGKGGQPRLTSPYCNAKARVKVELTNTGALLDLILRGIKGVINNQVRTGLETKLCQVVKKVVEKDANALLSKFPLSTNLDKALGAMGNLVGLKEGAGMILRYGLVRNAEMSPAFDHVTLGLEGEVSKDGRGGLPFFPKPLVNARGQSLFPDYSSRMRSNFYGLSQLRRGMRKRGIEVYAHVSDHMLNSFLWSMTRAGVLRFDINPQTFPQFAGLLKTSCLDFGGDSGAFGGFCLGDFLEDLADNYEDHDIALVFEPDEAPTFFFKEGLGVISAKGDSLWKVRPEGAADSDPWTTVYWTKLDFGGEVKLEMKEDKLTADMRITRLDADVAKQDDSFRKSLDDTQWEVEDLLATAREFMSGGGSGMFGEGFPLPSIKGMRWREPDVRIRDGYLRLKSLFELNRRIIEDMVLKAIRKANFG